MTLGKLAWLRNNKRIRGRPYREQDFLAIKPSDFATFERGPHTFETKSKKSNPFNRIGTGFGERVAHDCGQGALRKVQDVLFSTISQRAMLEPFGVERHTSAPTW